MCVRLVPAIIERVGTHDPKGSELSICERREPTGTTYMAKILVADDSSFVRVKLVSILQTAGHDVIETVDGTTVLKWAIAEQPDVIVLDLMMPGVDGWTTLGDLKIHESTLDIPVIISSSLNSDADLIRAHRMGAFDFLPKPWTSDDLVKRIRWASLAHQAAA